MSAPSTHTHTPLILIDTETLRSRRDQIILAPLPLLSASPTHTHTNSLHHHQPPPIRLSLSAAPCCRCFQRSELFVCSEARRLIACVGLRLPLPPHLNLSRYQPTPRQLQPCLLKGTLPLEIMERLGQIDGVSICHGGNLGTDRMTASGWFHVLQVQMHLMTSDFHLRPCSHRVHSLRWILLSLYQFSWQNTCI